jgi:RND family efflux transporter MFP subunit
MDDKPLGRLIHSLRRLTDPLGAGLSDGELLERFVAQRDAAALELLVRRHGPMVLGACRRVLLNPHDAEDAFQATFLVLLRKARSIRRGTALGGWLHRVACRAALRLRASLAKRKQRETAGVEDLTAPPEDAVQRRELRRILDEEVDRLPARQRVAFVLCCLEGKTSAEAARELGCPPGTVSSRVTRARRLLRNRLTRRGVVPALGAATAWLAGEIQAATVPSALASATVQTARLLARGTAAQAIASPQTISLVNGVLRAMFLSQLRTVSLLLVLAGALAVGGAFARHALSAAPPNPEEPPRAADAPAPKDKKPELVAVQVAHPTVSDQDQPARLSCTVQPANQVELVAAVPGVLTGPLPDIGTPVKKGELLAKIEAPDLTLDAARAAAQVQEAKGQVELSQARIRVAEAEAAAAKGIVRQRQAELESATAGEAAQKIQWDNTMLLRNQKVTSDIEVRLKEQPLLAARAQVRAAQATVETAKADVLAKEGRLIQTQADLTIAKAALEVAKVSSEKAKFTLSLTEIRAPFDGIVTRRVYQSGHYFRAGEPRDHAIITVQQIDRVRVVVHVSNYDAARVKVGDPVTLRMAMPGVPPLLEGNRVSRTAFALDPLGLRVEIDVPNPELQLRPGMSGMVAIQLAKEPQALFVPLSALSANWDAVYVVRDGKAYRVLIAEPNQMGGRVRIPSGLKLSDLVVQNAKGLTGDAIPVKVGNQHPKSDKNGPAAGR